MNRANGNFVFAPFSENETQARLPIHPPLAARTCPQPGAEPVGPLPHPEKLRRFRSCFDSSQARQTVRWGRFRGLEFAIRKRVKRTGSGPLVPACVFMCFHALFIHAPSRADYGKPGAASGARVLAGSRKMRRTSESGMMCRHFHGLRAQ